jgi:hypothetical protein
MVVMVTDGVIDAFSEGQNGEEMLERFLLKQDSQSSRNG